MRNYVMVFVWILVIAAVPLDLAAQKKGESKAKPAPKKAQSQVPKVNADDVFKKAFEAHVAGNQTEAIELFQFGLKREPDDANGWYFLGVSMLAANDLDGAIATIGLGRGMGSPIQQARAEQIHDELFELKQALPRFTMREGWVPLLAQALRLYQPPTAGKYRIVSETMEYKFDKAADKKNRLASCGYSLPSGLEGATGMTLKHADEVWPRLLKIGDKNARISYSGCTDRKKNTVEDDESQAISIISNGSSLWLGTNDQQFRHEMERSITVLGNPYVLKPAAEWQITTPLGNSVRTDSGKFQSDGVPVLPEPFGTFPAYRLIINIESSTDRDPISINYSTAGVPFEIAYGVKRGYTRSFSMTLSDGTNTNYSSEDTRQTLLSKTGSLDRPGDILEFESELENQTSITTYKGVSEDTLSKVVTKTRVERLR